MAANRSGTKEGKLRRSGVLAVAHKEVYRKVASPGRRCVERETIGVREGFFLCERCYRSRPPGLFLSAPPPGIL